jgi:hypothetical protein
MTILPLKSKFVGSNPDQGMVMFSYFSGSRPYENLILIYRFLVFVSIRKQKTNVRYVHRDVKGTNRAEVHQVALQRFV